MTTATALFIGDVSWDTTVLAPRMPEPDEKVLAELCVDAVGGVAANSAVACAMAGTDVVFYSTVADDAGGESVASALEHLGLTARLETTGGATARAIIMLDDGGEKRLFLYQGHRMYPSVAAAATLPLDGVRWMHTAVYDAESAATIITRCSEASIPWSIDLEPATIPRDLALLSPHLDGCQTVMVNARASAAVGPDVVERLFALGVKEVVETRGPDGVRMHRPGIEATDVRPPALASPVRDTTGAGDAFAGWYVAERVRGSSIELALQRAVSAASHSVQFLGTSASYPMRSEILGVPHDPSTKERQP